MSDTEDFQSQSLSKKTLRRSYLITYSQCIRETFPSRESFGQAVASTFDEEGVSKFKVEYWASALENHKNGGEHYHVIIKLSGPKRWVQVKSKLAQKYGITVNFSEAHDNY